MVLVRWEETHSKQARFGGRAPGSQGFAWRGLQAGEPVGRTSRTPVPAPHLSWASPAPPISCPHWGRALRPSVGPSLLSSPNVRIPGGNGAGTPSGPHCRGRGRFSPREGKGDRRVVLAWGQEPRRVTSPKTGGADPRGLTAAPPPPSPQRGIKTPGTPFGRDAPPTASATAVRSSLGPGPVPPALEPPDRDSSAPGSSPAHRPHPAAPRNRRAQPRRGLAGGSAWASAP